MNIKSIEEMGMIQLPAVKHAVRFLAFLTLVAMASANAWADLQTDASASVRMQGPVLGFICGLIRFHRSRYRNSGIFRLVWHHYRSGQSPCGISNTKGLRDDIIFGRQYLVEF